MSKIYVCPFCGVEKLSKDQMNFHLNYSHSTILQLMREGVEINQIEEKLESFYMRKRVLEKEIELLKKIVKIKNDKSSVLVYAT